ncbi:type II toxin-antitoxin system PemK/MazF family toxin [Pseudarthrobacter sp. J1738]|uniref:type II toxin-antitoxin system PemK/MazF family toxin n=1 Tax=unclassified Pseudarthrobacter TaxID=2647000 RepID=UPI003D2D2DB8
MATILGRFFNALLKSFASGASTRSDRPSRQTSRPKTSRRKTTTRPGSSSGVHNDRVAAARSGEPASSDAVLADFTGASTVQYSPNPDGKADPGEVVWTWVPYQEDPSQGKDRPVLLVGKNGKHLLALMLTSKDHTGAGRRDEDYLDIGAGPWDKQGRPSEVKTDRVLRVDPAGIRREGAILDPTKFKLVAHALREQHGWT